MRLDRWQDDEPAPQAKQPPLVFGDPESIARMHRRESQSPSPSQMPTGKAERSAMYQGILFVRRILSLVPFAGAAYLIFLVITKPAVVSVGSVLGFIGVWAFFSLFYVHVLEDVIDWDFLDRIKKRLFAVFGVQRSERDAEWETSEAVPGIDYYRYLESNEWKQQRDYMLQRAGYCCERCSRQGRLEVHHLTYKRLGNERPEDLVVLCPDCHELVHSQGLTDR